MVSFTLNAKSVSVDAEPARRCSGSSASMSD